MAAELRLNVALDLQYFKQQLPKLSRAAAGFELPIKVKFDRRTINNELRLLGQQFSKRRNYVINVNDTQLKETRIKAEKLVNYLKQNLTGKKHIVEIEYREKGRPGGPGGFAAGPQGAAGLAEYMRTQGLSGGNIAGVGRRERFRGVVEESNVKQLRSMASRAGIKGGSKMRKADLQSRLMGIADGLMEDILGNIQNRMRKGPFGHIASGQTGGRLVPDRFDKIAASGLMPRGSGLPQLPAISQDALRRATQDLSAQRFTAPSLPARSSGPARPRIPNRGFSRFGPSGGQMFNQLKPGPIASVGREFANATQQVLLFGTAYKGIAAVMALPGSIATATANLQAFNNQMEAVTGGGEVMANSMTLIQQTVDRFNIPVQSARNGFVKLFASMSPAGIDLSTINNVFTGLSAAASTFGMSADQVDRMTYALAQMASKGQIMTEELKGQLGDVFPQAVSLFAEAAGFLDESMDAQAKSEGLAAFLKALEDGALKGTAMSQVLSNVGGLLNTKFGPSADKAAGSFQNQMNKLNNAMVEFHESFAPVAGAFLGEVVNPMVSALNVIGQAVKLAFSDELVTGNPLAQYLREELFPQLLNVKNALIAGAQTFGLFAQAAAIVLRPIAQFILGNQQLVTTLVRAAAVGMVFKAALVGLRITGIIPLIGFIVKYNKVVTVLIAQNIRGAAGLGTLNKAAIASGLGMRQAAVGVRILATAIRTVLVASAIGIALVAISALIGKIMQLKATADSIKNQKGAYGARVRRAAEQSGTEGMNVVKRQVEQERDSRQRGIDIGNRLARGETVSKEDMDHIESLGGFEGTINSVIARDGGFGVRRTVHGEAGAHGDARAPGTMFETGAAETDTRNARAALDSSLVGFDKDLRDAALNAAVVDRRFEEAAKVNLEGLGLDLDGGGDGGGAGREDISQTMFQAKQRLSQANRALITDQSQINEMERIAAEFAVRKLEISESDAGAREKAAQLAQAQVDRDREAFQVQEDFARKEEERAQKMKDARQQVLEMVREAALASGELTEEEFERLKILEKQAREIAYIRDQVKKNNMTPEEGELAIGAISRGAAAKIDNIGDDMSARGGLKDWVEKTKKELEDFNAMAESAADGIAGEFGKAFSGILQGTMSLQEGLGQAFTNIGAMFADMVAQMLVKYAMMQIFKGIFGFSDGGVVNASGGGGTPSGGGGSPLAGVIGLTAANGAVWQGGFTPFATGGVVNGPTLGLVGEGRFNEAIVPLPNGKSIPVEMNGSAGSNIATNITVNVNNGQVSSQSSGKQGNNLARNLEGAVKQVIMREMQPGGLISSKR